MKLNSATAKQVVQTHYPDAKEIQFVEHSYDNLVVLIDQKYALRFPRNESALARSQYEKYVLQGLASIQDIAVPKVLDEFKNPACLVTSFLHGEHSSSYEIRSWPQALQAELGERIALFAYQMHSLLPVTEARKLRKQFKLDEQREEPWDIYFAKLFQTSLPNPAQKDVLQQYYTEWQSLKVNTEVVVHDDLHTENMLFQDKHLTGILDFGDTNIGSPEQELRQLYRINETVLVAAVKQYEKLSGLRLNVRAIKVWAIMQELAVYIEHFSANEFEHHAFHRASFNLNRWLATDMWNLDEIHEATIRQ